MGKSKNRSLKLGLLVSVGLLLFVLAVYFLGSKQNLFSSTFIVKSHFYDVKGLVEGNKVRYSGINVGTVSSIDIISDSTILVEMSIEQDVREFIRKDSKVEIGREGLMGSKIVFIHPGSASAGTVENDDRLESIRAIDVEDMLKQAKQIIDDGRSVSKNLLEMSDKINHGDGDLARLINDNTITTTLNKTGKELYEIAQNANAITDKVNRGEGDLGRLVNDTTISYNITTSLDNLNETTARADSIAQELHVFSRELNEGNGLIHRLVYDENMAENVDTAIAKVDIGVDEVVQTAEAIRESWILNLFSGRNRNKRN